ncbi:MAG: twin-arginine translocation signal domain-containing protein [Calditrichaeota bacterium]|nr:twin-arginine translocation signal domain-containing protein [Calditrichota bacterium]
MTDEKKASQRDGEGMSRRHFIATTAAAAAAFTIVPRHVLGGPGYTPPSENINLAIIGVGGQGTHDMRQLMTSEGTRVVAVADPVRRADYSKVYFGGFKGRDPAKELVEEHYADQLKSGSYKGCATYEDFREMLVQEKDIDAVVVATTDSVHAVATMATIKAGKHVYTEKPMTHHTGPEVPPAAPVEG